ncbi:MAG: Forkhead-associated protein [Planctomycetaceae bacterium]|nr:Forkhead-associated protein [Planctomycetaceae bacterium]
MQVVLRIANGKSNVRQVRLHADTTIGRSPDCQLKVASNQISRRHCQIVIRDMSVAIKDLGSANGTFVNGRQIPAEVEVPLTPGTRVALGPLQFSVEYELPGVVAARDAQHAETDTTPPGDDATYNVDADLGATSGPQSPVETIEVGAAANAELSQTVQIENPEVTFDLHLGDEPAPLLAVARKAGKVPMPAIAQPVTPSAAIAGPTPVTAAVSQVSASVSGEMAFGPGANMSPPSEAAFPWSPQPAQPVFTGPPGVQQPASLQPWNVPQPPVTNTGVTFVPGSIPPLAQFITQEVPAGRAQNFVPPALTMPPPNMPQVWPGFAVTTGVPVTGAPVTAVPVAAAPLTAIPVQVIASPVSARAPAAPIVPPGWAIPDADAESADPTETASVLEDDESTFNFGIYAASGSGIIVENAPRISTDSSATAASKSGESEPKAAKKGLLQMFGWGKKKSTTAATPPVSPAPAAAVMPPGLDGRGADAVEVGESSFVPPGLEMPEETEHAEEAQTPPEDESLQSFFNQFK